MITAAATTPEPAPPATTATARAGAANEQPASAGEDQVFVTADEKYAIAGNLEAAHRALDRAWALWTARAGTRAWDGQYWNHDDVADLERLNLDALNAVEASWQALILALAGSHVPTETAEP